MLARLLITISSLVLLHSAYSAWQARIAADTGGFEVESVLGARVPPDILVEAVSSFITLVIGILWSAPALKGVTFASEMSSRSVDSTDLGIAFANSPQYPMLALRLARPSAFRSLLPRLPSAPLLPRATFGTDTSGWEDREEFQPGQTWRTVKRKAHEQDLEEAAEDASHLMTLEEINKMLDPARYRPGAKVESLKAGQPIELHPMLDDVDFLYIDHTHSCSPGARLEVWTESGDVVSGNAYSDPATEEMATSPPCSRLVVRIRGDVAADIVNVDGVTVRELLDGVAGFWDRPVSDEVAVLPAPLSSPR
ncbi:hypothetical protein JCM10296v2_006963 [Rhodotorula toruloides]